MCIRDSHDVVQALVNLFKGPGEAQAVLAHFQAGGSNAAGVGCLSRGKQDAVLLQVRDVYKRQNLPTASRILKFTVSPWTS